MTPEEMRAAATKLRGHAKSGDATRNPIIFDGMIRAARLLDRLAANPERDPVEAFTTPPQRMRVLLDADGKVVSAEMIPVEPHATDGERS